MLDMLAVLCLVRMMTLSLPSAFLPRSVRHVGLPCSYPCGSWNWTGHHFAGHIISKMDRSVGPDVRLLSS